MHVSPLTLCKTVLPVRSLAAPHAQISRFGRSPRPLASRPEVLRGRAPALAQRQRLSRQQAVTRSEETTFTSETNKAANPLRIVFVSAEVGPWSKTGGLGDVVGGLPIALAQRGHNVLTIAPRYHRLPVRWLRSLHPRVHVLSAEVLLKS